MSAPMKKPYTETIVIGHTRFKVPKETAKAVLILLKSALRISSNEMILAQESATIQKLDAKYTRAGTCLQGARTKEGMSQVELAEKLGIPQTNLSKMELGKRPIGKRMAKRIANVLNVDYRSFL